MSLSTRKAGFAAAAVTMAAVLAAGATPADAQQRRRGGNGSGIAAGVTGGLAAGAVLGGALAGPRYDGDPYGAGVVDDQAGYSPAYAGDEGCGLVRRPIYDRAGRFLGYGNVPTC